MPSSYTSNKDSFQFLDIIIKVWLSLNKCSKNKSSRKKNGESNIELCWLTVDRQLKLESPFSVKSVAVLPVLFLRVTRKSTVNYG